ncbi:heterokaryon incompatibility protein-domain-containing protein [Colletotrichum acutatum]|uniref:Heterokaryon incompatibility protein-domain-containing protein n=1 Tax=Glomerella acutata TaxID=27357 RepID=A0AAD8UB98_GLOAC|nr:heterokaryon incompatibility protein-domain-containing protein [Colletotrichum acutatum]KAK1705464.1 heterokaryon incompatibility protein-domain-containing protein [Colletotrichum acutatum]
MLCKSCNDLADARIEEAERHTEQARGPSSSRVLIHHATWASFEDAVGAGCHLCTSIHEELAAEGLVPDSHSDTAQLYVQAHAPTAMPSGYLVFSPSIACRTGASFYMLKNQGQSPSSDEHAESLRLVEGDIGQEDKALTSTRTWLRDCISNHAGYCGKDTGGFVPTRLLDLEVRDTDDVRLSTAVPVHETYATLSHCWGKSEILTLRRANMESFQAGIRVETLSKTFRDTISLLRRLGLRYLWIDSLCIIQDSVDDWRKESVTMAEVYRNGTINIAATAASGGDEGLYFAPHPIHSRHLRVSFNQSIDGTLSEGPTSGERPLVVEAGDYFLLNSKIWQRGVEEAPLNTRGWVLQERLFSPRVIHFSRHQLFWQCGMDYRIGQFAYSNDRIGSFGKAYTNRDPRAFSQVLWRLKSMTKEEKDPLLLEEAYLPWEEVVTTYTAQHLTKGEDRLIAVQALAKTMEEAVDDCYVAGLWESRLVEDLLWACSAQGERARYSRQTTWRAPTWSWASMNGGSVKKATLTGRYAGRKVFEGEALVKSIKHCVEGYDGVTTGQLKSARLQLDGCLLKSAISWEGHAVLSDGNVKGISMRCPDPGFRTFIVCPDEWNWDGADKLNYQLPAGSILLAIGTHLAYKAAGTDPNPCIEGLVLHDAGQKGSLSFCRTGYFKLVAEGTISNACLAGEEGALFTRHQSVSGDGTCTLNLF